MIIIFFCFKLHINIELFFQLKKLVDETRIIDEIDDEVWLLNFIEELEIHLTYLCSPNVSD